MDGIAERRHELFRHYGYLKIDAKFIVRSDTYDMLQYHIATTAALGMHQLLGQDWAVKPVEAKMTVGLMEAQLAAGHDSAFN